MRISSRLLVLATLVALTTGLLPAQLGISSPTTSVAPDNTLRQDFSFQSSQPARSYIQYGHVQGLDTLWQTTEVAGPATTHSHRAIGLLPRAPYVWRAIAFDSTGYAYTPWMNFSADTIPPGFPTLDSVWSDPSATPPGYILTSTQTHALGTLAQLWNRAGDLIWYQVVPGDPNVYADRYCQSFHYDITTRRLLMISCDSLYDQRLDGRGARVIRPQGLPAGTIMHHDIARVNSNRYAVLTAKDSIIDQSATSGDPTALVIGDGLAEFDSTGAVLRTWSSFDDYNPQITPAPGGYWTLKYGPDAIDWKGANSFLRDVDNNYLLAFAHENHVMKIDNADNDPAWTCGQNGSIVIVPTDTFKAPSSMRQARPNFYLLYDRDGLGNANRVMEWWIDWGYTFPEMLITWEYEIPAPYTSNTTGHVEQGLNGNRIIATGSGAAILEVKPDGGLAWFGHLPIGVDRAYCVEHLYRHPPLAYTGADIFCVSDSVITLTANPPGGYWSGPFVQQGVFDAAAAGAGAYTLLYRWGPDTLSVPITVDANPNCSVSTPEPDAPIQDLAIFPNPFLSGFELQYHLARKTTLDLSLYGADGRQYYHKTLIQGPGQQKIEVKGLDLPAGPLWLRLTSTDGNILSRLLVHQ